MDATTTEPVTVASGSSKSFQERMASVMDAITEACPSRNEPKYDLDTGEDDDSTHRSRSPLSRKRRRWPHSGSEGQEDHRRHHYYEGRDRGRRGRDVRSRAPFKADHIVNPSKWTKYDLTDDGTKELRKSGMSADQVNKYAAFEFLNKLKKKDSENSDADNQREAEESGGKVVFKKPAKKLMKNSEEKRTTASGGGGSGGGVCVMPEYVVGGNKTDEKKEKKGRKHLTVLGRGVSDEDDNTRTSKKKKSSQCVNLSHLEDDDQDDL